MNSAEEKSITEWMHYKNVDWNLFAGQHIKNVMWLDISLEYSDLSQIKVRGRERER